QINYRFFELPGKDALYPFGNGLTVLLTYYANGCGSAYQLEMSRTTVDRFIQNLDNHLSEMMEKSFTFLLLRLTRNGVK
ncbi:hypothetical protein GN958_ATG14432, partial [Phytophthora infestans]